MGNPFKPGTVVTCVDNFGHKVKKRNGCNPNGVTEGHDYIITGTSLAHGWPEFIGDDGKTHSCIPSRFVVKKVKNQVRKGDVLICVHTGSGATAGQEYTADQDFLIESYDDRDSLPGGGKVVDILDEKRRPLRCFTWRFNLKEDQVSQREIQKGDVVIVVDSPGSSLPAGAEVNVRETTSVSINVMNMNGRNAWYNRERFKLKDEQESMIGKTMVVTKTYYPLHPGDTFVVTGEKMYGSESMWTYTHPDRPHPDPHLHPKNQCKLAEEQPAAPEPDRKKNRWGETEVRKGDKVRYKIGSQKIETVEKVHTHSDGSQTVYLSGNRNGAASAFDLILEEPQQETTNVTITAQNPTGAKVGDRVLVEGVLTRGPDSDNDFAIRFDGKTTDQFVPAKSISKITVAAKVEPKFKKGDRVRMNSGRLSYTDTRKRGIILSEHAGTYFIEWTGGELGSTKEVNTVKEVNLLPA